jgi:hypothetical protein
MKIAFFTEMEFNGKIPRTHKNMRTEFAWMVALNATHYNLKTIPKENYDLGIVIFPKKFNNHFSIDRIRKSCKQVALMQEGPNWYWQDYELPQQVYYYNTLMQADYVFVHNETDKKYFQGLLNNIDSVHVMPSLMIEDSISNIDYINRSNVIIGGNFVSWYGGFDSYITAQKFQNEKIYAPSMGRKQEAEDQLINHLPYMNWVSWINSLNTFKYGIHLMRTHAAGTFALNCAYLGIPCIGYAGLDTQEKCHPELTVNLSDLEHANHLAEKLYIDEKFYQHCSITAKENYNKYYHENIFIKNIKRVLE